MALKSTFNPAVNAALTNIRESLANQQRVSFVYHSWQEFNNLTLAGFKFPQIPEKQIPRLSLIPIVAIQQSLLGSRLSTSTNRHVPYETKFQQDIDMSIRDLTQRFAQFGMVVLPSLETTIDELDGSVLIFDIITRGITPSTVLEIIPEYFGVESPVEYQFNKPRVFSKMTAMDYLNEALAVGEITQSQFARGEAAIAELGRSAYVSHLIALDPSEGILPKTLRAISERMKFRFDVVDEWLTRQFPSFDARGNLTNAKQDGNTDVLEKLVELLAAKVAPSEVPTNAISATVTSSESPKAASEPEKVQCSATKKDGEPCKGTAIEGTDFCRFHTVK